jgi:hypothetical protein
VVVFSLLSITIEVEDVAAVTMNPSFGAPFNHACTWLVTGIER